MSAISEGVMHMDETMAFLMPRGGGGTMLAAVNVLERACPDYKGLHVNLCDLLLPHEEELVRAASQVVRS